MYKHIPLKKFSSDMVDRVLDQLIDESCGVIAASKTFGVDGMDEEEFIKERGRKKRC